ncbi:unnamed protein product [Chrysoparadoxa australica]
MRWLGSAIVLVGLSHRAVAFLPQTTLTLAPSALTKTHAARRREPLPINGMQRAAKHGSQLQLMSSATGEDSQTEVDQFVAATFEQKVQQVLDNEQLLSLVLNSLVVAAFGIFAMYKLASVDLEISRGWTWYEVLLRVPGDNFYRYEDSATEFPIVTKALTSCVAYGIGDFVAQCFQGNKLDTIDLKRSARSAAAGLMVHGPLCHFWIMWMQANLDFNGAWWNFIPKVIADQTVYSVFLNAAYTTVVIGLKLDKSPKEIFEEVRSTAWPALSSSWRFWPLIHCVSFNNIIPVEVKLLFIDMMEIIWVTILSTVANKDRQGGEEVAETAGH